jgi:HEAT repeat protein
MLGLLFVFLISLALISSPYAPSGVHAADETDAEMLARLDQGIEAVISFKYGDAGNVLVDDLEHIVFQLAADSPLRGAVEKKLLDALETATPDGRAVLCSQLFVIGTDQSIPVLEKWLKDPQTGNFALYALGRNESPLVDQALRRALKDVTGPLQIGVIDTLAKRRVRTALPDLVQLVDAPDQQVVCAAVRAIGQLGGKEGLHALQSVGQVSDRVRRAVDSSLLLCAEQFVADGDTASAVPVYEAFLDRDASVQLRRAGLRGLVMTQPDKALAVLVKAIKEGDPDFGLYAISLVNETADADALKTFAALLPEVSDPVKVLLLRSLGDRRDASVQDAVLDCLAASTDVDVRVAAVATLGQVGTSRALPALLAEAASGENREKTVATSSLVYLQGDDIDARLCEAAAQADAEIQVRVTAIQTLARRDAAGANRPLVQMVRDGSSPVRLAAIAALGSLATEEEIPVLLTQLVGPLDPSDSQTIQDACRRGLTRLGDSETSCELVVTSLHSAPAKSKPAVLPLLTCSGSDAALKAVYSAYEDADPALKAAAVRTLADWPHAAPVEAMVRIFQTAVTDDVKQTALKGCIRLANLSENPSSIYVRILKQVKDVNDQKQILEGMGTSCGTPEMLELALSYMQENPGVRPNAGLAAVRIANRVRYNDEALAKRALSRVRNEVNHADVEQRALNVLNEIDKQEGHIFDWLIAGPFKEKGKEGEAIYNTAFGPESEDADDVQWKPITNGQKTWSIDIEQALGAHDFCAAYFRTYVWSSKEQDALFEAGADDAIKVWVNGDLCYEQWRTGGPEPRSMNAEIALKEGWNELLVKVADHQGGWEFGSRIRQRNGLELEGLKYQKVRP